MPMEAVVSSCERNDYYKGIFLQALKHILSDILRIKTANFSKDTRLLSDIPEFDSMAIMSLLITLESQFNISIDDLDLNVQHSTMLGKLHDLV